MGLFNRIHYLKERGLSQERQASLCIFASFGVHGYLLTIIGILSAATTKN
jgi:hypothetical protein